MAYHLQNPHFSHDFPSRAHPKTAIPAAAPTTPRRPARSPLRPRPQRHHAENRQSYQHLNHDQSSLRLTRPLSQIAGPPDHFFRLRPYNPPMKRPNILVITTDQQSANALSCAGNPYLHTPAMDSLAAHGIRFDLAYAANPICVASRT